MGLWGILPTIKCKIYVLYIKALVQVFGHYHIEKDMYTVEPQTH